MRQATSLERIHEVPMMVINRPSLIPMTEDEWQEAILRASYVCLVGNNEKHDERA
jgi:hypothetical protein